MFDDNKLEILIAKQRANHLIVTGQVIDRFNRPLNKTKNLIEVVADIAWSCGKKKKEILQEKVDFFEYV